MSGADTVLLHASAFVLKGTGVLVRGASGSGKSTLILSLLHTEREAAQLVADDQVELVQVNDRVAASAPAGLAGLIEVRGQGVFRLPYRQSVEIALVVDLAEASSVPRFPEGDEQIATLLGVRLPRIYLASGDPGGPAKVGFALARRERHGETIGVRAADVIRSGDR